MAKRPLEDVEPTPVEPVKKKTKNAKKVAVEVAVEPALPEPIDIKLVRRAASQRLTSQPKTLSKMIERLPRILEKLRREPEFCTLVRSRELTPGSCSPTSGSGHGDFTWSG